MPFDIGQIQIQPRAGAIRYEGSAVANQSLADAIRQHKATHDELKGYQTILGALAADPQNGIDPDSIDKMSLPVAKNMILASEIRKQQAQNQQAGQAQASVPDFLGDVAGNMQPRPDVRGSAFVPTLAGGNPTMPGMTPLMAAITAASKHPAVLQTKIGQNVLETAIKEGLVTPKAPPQPFDMNGVKGVLDPNTGRITQPTPGADMSGPPVIDITDLPFGGKGAVLRGSKDLKVFPDPANIAANREQMTGAQLAAARTKAFSGVLEARRTLNSFKMVKDIDPSQIQDAQDTLDAAQAEYELYGGKPAGGVNPDGTAKAKNDFSTPASQRGGKTITTKGQFDALPAGTIYTGKDGKQYRKP